MFALELQRANGVIDVKRNTGNHRPTIIIVKDDAGNFDMGASRIVTSDVAKDMFGRAFLADREFHPDSKKMSKRSAADIIKICKRFGLPVKKPSSQRKRTKSVLIGALEKLLVDFNRIHGGT